MFGKKAVRLWGRTLHQGTACRIPIVQALPSVVTWIINRPQIVDHKLTTQQKHSLCHFPPMAPSAVSLMGFLHPEHLGL